MLAPVFMKLTFKTEREILREVEVSKMTDEIQKEFRAKATAWQAQKEEEYKKKEEDE